MKLASYFRSTSQYGIVIFLILLSIYFAYATDGIFLSARNIENVSRQIAINTILAVGLTFVIISGGIDLSVGSVLALAGVISMKVLCDGLVIGQSTVIHPLSTEYAIILSAVIALLVGAIAGAFNGLVITIFRVAPFVATLGMMTIARGLAYVYTDGRPVSPLPRSVREFGASTIPHTGIPTLVFIALLVVALGHLMLARMKFGRHVYAIGGNEEAARLSGINVAQSKLKIYVLCGMLAGLGGMLLATRLASGDPKSGTMFELNAIAAAVLGGTSLMGGRGTVLGTLIGALVIGVLDNGLILLGVSAFYQMVAKGFVILGAVILDQLTRRP
ncbi:MAG: ABC transporter permease [Armatimonadetes bacterium]|nr:ABC transporter permease [Armatimonadota bacterium]